jgi:hypothetical protein
MKISIGITKSSPLQQKDKRRDKSPPIYFRFIDFWSIQNSFHPHDPWKIEMVKYIFQNSITNGKQVKDFDLSKIFNQKVVHYMLQFV